MLSNTYLKINLDNYRFNINYLKKHSNKNLIAIIKANAYGAIDYKCAEILNEEGVDFFGVSSLLEALSLRRHGIRGEILILGYVDPQNLDTVIKNSLSIATVSKDYVNELLNYDISGLKIHLKIDTGMNRIGLFKDEVKDTLNKLLDKGAKIEGIFTHYATSDEDLKFTAVQYQRFKDVLHGLNYNFKYIHTSNTDATVAFNDEVSNYVRCGLGLLGYSSYKSELKPCVSLHSKVINCKLAKKDTAISYGQHYHLLEDEYIATVAIGYADGLLRSNTGRHVYIDGEYAEIVGSICMDQMMVHINKPVAIKSDVEIFGEHISLYDMANDNKTIPYEILTSISDRVTRVYVDSEDNVLDIISNRYTKEENHD